MKGVIRIKNKYSGTIWGYYLIDEIGSLDEAFNKIIEENRYLQKTKILPALIPETVYEGEEAEKVLALFLFPNISRVKYGESCFEHVSDKGISKWLNRTIDWLVENFEDKRYEFLIEMTGTNRFEAFVFDEKVLKERYSFMHSQSPKYRTMY